MLFLFLNGSEAFHADVTIQAGNPLPLRASAKVKICVRMRHGITCIPILPAENIHSMSLHHRQGGLAVSTINLMQKILRPIVNEILGSSDG